MLRQGNGNAFELNLNLLRLDFRMRLTLRTRFPREDVLVPIFISLVIVVGDEADVVADADADALVAVVDRLVTLWLFILMDV